MVDLTTETRLVAEGVDLVIEERDMVTCPNCNQRFEEVIPVWIGAQENPNGKIENQDVLCEGCCEAIFGYVPDAEPINVETIENAYLPFKLTENTLYLFLISLFTSTLIAGVAMLITHFFFPSGSIEQRLIVAAAWAVAFYVFFISPVEDNLKNDD